MAHPFHVCTLRVYKQLGGFVISKWSFQKGPRDFFFSDLNRSSIFLVLKEKKKKKDSSPKKNIKYILLVSNYRIPHHERIFFFFFNFEFLPPNKMRESTHNKQIDWV